MKELASDVQKKRGSGLVRQGRKGHIMLGAGGLRWKEAARDDMARNERKAEEA